MKTRITREVELPDPVKIARYKKAPELGPRILFFSGGSALRDLSREIIRYTHNSIHIITPFDSGGSSAVLREAFRMPAIGDVRNRLMALADKSLHGNPAIFNLFAFRFPKKAAAAELAGELDRMVRGKHKLVAGIPDPMRKIIRNHLGRFRDKMPAGFNLRGASIGNLVLTAGYLENRRHLDPVIYIFSRLVLVRGVVRAVTSSDLHLAAELENGRTIIGQHLLTGKEAPPIESRISRMFLNDGLDAVRPAETAIRGKNIQLIRDADLICFPMGSFYTSLLANLLPSGVGSAVASNACPKIYIPSTGNDPECAGLDVNAQVELLLQYLKRDNPGADTAELLNFVLIDSASGAYPGKPGRKHLKSLGLDVLDCELVTKQSRPYIDSRLLANILLSLT